MTYSLPNRGWLGRMAGVLLLLVAGVVFSYAHARHYVRVNADFSYARDNYRADRGPAFIEAVSLEEAQGWIGSGRTESLAASNGFAPALGVGYRFVHKMFLLDVGLGMEYRYRINRPYDVSDVKKDAVDETNMPYVGCHTWNNRETRFQNLGITLPVMVGLEWRRLYAMAGVRANVDVWGTARETGEYSLRGDYEMFMNSFVNIPVHGFVADEPYRHSVALSMGWDVRVCAEIGYCLNGTDSRNSYRRKQQAQYYIGAFAEYAVVTAKEHYTPLLVGLRLTALLPVAEKPACKCLGY